MRIKLMSVCAFTILTAFVAVSQNATLNKWHARLPTILTACCSVSTNFIAVGGSGIVITSSDGTNWAISHPCPDCYFTGVCHGNGTYLAVGFKSIPTASNTLQTGVIWASTNCQNWSLQGERPYPLRSACFDNGVFCILGSHFLNTSADGSQWTTNELGKFGDFTSATSGNSNVVVVGQFEIVTITKDGPQHISFGPNVSFFSVVYANSLFVAAGEVRSNAAGQWHSEASVFTSKDGLVWNRSKVPASKSARLISVAFGAGRFVGLGIEGVIFSSPDGLKWDLQGSPLGTSVQAICFGNSKFHIAGSYLSIWESDN